MNADGILRLVGSIIDIGDVPPEKYEALTAAVREVCAKRDQNGRLCDAAQERNRRLLERAEKAELRIKELEAQLANRT